MRGGSWEAVVLNLAMALCAVNKHNSFAKAYVWLGNWWSSSSHCNLCFVDERRREWVRALRKVYMTDHGWPMWHWYRTSYSYSMHQNSVSIKPQNILQKRMDTRVAFRCLSKSSKASKAIIDLVQQVRNLHGQRVVTVAVVPLLSRQVVP